MDQRGETPDRKKKKKKKHNRGIDVFVVFVFRTIAWNVK
jgi:hypothetical protein